MAEDAAAAEAGEVAAATEEEGQKTDALMNLLDPIFFTVADSVEQKRINNFRAKYQEFRQGNPPVLPTQRPAASPCGFPSRSQDAALRQSAWPQRCSFVSL